MKFKIAAILFTFANIVLPTFSHAQTNVLWTYNMSDGSVIHNMSDNGKWAVAYGVSDATSTYSYPKLIDFTSHSVIELLSETDINRGIECYVNDVTDDGLLVAGCYESQPAYYNTSTKKWNKLALKEGNAGGRVEAITPDGRYAVGVCTNGGFDEVPTMWDLSNNTILTLSNLPSTDLSGGYQNMVRFTGISADGRYIVGCVSYSYPSDVLYFLYDREAKSWDAIAFDFNTFTRQFTPRDEAVRTLDGVCISPNGKWVAGVVYSVDNVRNPYRYNVETKTFENFNAPEDLDKGCVSVDNEGTIYAATPAINPSRSLYIRQGKYWYGLDEILKQNFNVDFYTQTGYQTTGLAVGISADCKTMAGIAYISHENYQITLPTTLAEACKKVNLLGNYNVSVRNGATIQKISNITLSFTRDVDVLASAQDICLKDASGNVVRNALKIALESTSSKSVIVGFRTTTLEADKSYTVEIPAGAISIKGDATQVNDAITLNYIGSGSAPISMTSVTPTEGSAVGHLDIATNPVVFSFTNDVAVKEGAKALIYCNEDEAPTEELNILQGNTAESYNMVLVHPTTTLNLYKGNTYRIVIPAGSLTDAAGFNTNVDCTVSYEGTYERTIVSDNDHIYIEDFSTGINNVMLFDADKLQPAADMQAWNFTSDQAWNYAADDDYTNTCATSHSMYTPTGASDDWMVTPQLLIADATCKLTFDAQSYHKNAADRLRVMVYATDKAIYELNADIVNEFKQQGEWVFDEQLSTGDSENTLNAEWTNYTVNLEKYAGKKVYIAFVNQNNNQSAIFVTNVTVKRESAAIIALNGVPETTVAATEQKVKGAIILKTADKVINNIHVALIKDETTVVDEVAMNNLALTAGDTLNFAFNKPLTLEVGQVCNFKIVATLNQGENVQEMSAKIQNLAFAPTKRVVLEENTGQGCQNCPLGHLALERLQNIYADRFIPLAYHTYTGDNLESGMTDYVQYFLNLTAAPSAMINRNGFASAPMVSYTEQGKTDYTFTSKTGDTWSDIVGKEFTTTSEADITIGAEYDESTGNIDITYAIKYAIDKTENNVGLLCVLTEDNIKGYQRNTFSTVTDEDLGEWQSGGIYGKSTVYPYIFNDVARALYPANAYNGQTGLVPNEVKHSKTYTGTITLNLSADAPYVGDITKCKVTCLMIDANTGRFINAARAKMGDTIAGVETIVQNNATLTARATESGILINTAMPSNVSIFDARGCLLTTTHVNGSTLIPLNQRGVVFIKAETGNTQEVIKVVK